jgi:hypothetical protein
MRNFVLEISDNVLVFLNMAATDLFDHFTLIVAFELTSSEIVYSFGGVLLVPSAYFLDSLLVNLI